MITERSISICVATSRTIWGSAIINYIHSKPMLICHGIANSIGEVFALLDSYPSEILLLDLDLIYYNSTSQDGLQLWLASIKSKWPQIRIVILTNTLQEIHAVLSGGADKACIKGLLDDHLYQAIVSTN